MKIAYKTLCIIILILCFIGCNKYNDSTYFNGNIYPINSRMKTSKNVELIPVKPLDGTNFGTISVYDSLLIFWNPKLPNFFFNVFNVDTGEEIGQFCNRGQGPEEVASISFIYQLFEEEKELKTLLFSANDRVIWKWNISKSILQQKTVLDSVIPYSRSSDNLGVFYDYIFLQNNDILFTRVQSMTLSEEEASLPFYQKRTLYSDSTLTDYPIYRKSIKNDEAFIIPEFFLGSVDAFKTDGSKIVQFMTHLQQFNILDTKTGETIGYRMNGSHDFSIFEEKKKVINTTYVRAQADDNYIYALYWGNEPWGIEDIPPINIIHVYDWSGNWLYEIKTDLPVHEMWLDKVRNRLYTTNLNVDDVFYIDLNEIKLI